MSNPNKENNSSEESNSSKSRCSSEVESSKAEKIRNRYSKDIELYHSEIEELNEKIRKEEDPSLKKHLEKMLLETRRALSDVLNKVNQL